MSNDPNRTDPYFQAGFRDGMLDAHRESVRELLGEVYPEMPEAERQIRTSNLDMEGLDRVCEELRGVLEKR